ncbi:MAG: beta-galactosidase [Lachnospiraceae bacterium]|nr:beta-galactosidase [Lachnospiraceae bacterium]
MSLYIGTNYHPHDWPRERWGVDIQLMKEAGLDTVRMGHLAWDSFEPQDGIYTFEWFDEVMNLFDEAGIRVVLDISLRPAPIWVHRLCPGCNICDKSGIVQESLHRYMEDVADPDYQFYAFRFAGKMMEHFRTHPALLAFGLCNEVGSGMLSYSEYARRRFIKWLEDKYGTIAELNKAWNTQRWCRRLSSFEDVTLQENEVSKGAPEAYIDMRRFFSDGQIAFMERFRELALKVAPGITCTTNLYVDNQNLGYDYLKENEKFMEYPGMGHYPFYDVDDWRQQYFLYVMKHDVGELNMPLWFLEFQTGTEGIAHGPRDFTYMQMMLGLLNRGQMALAWTWRTMYGGKEQFYHGVLGHDGYPTQNYEDLKHLARDYRKLEQYAFPYVPKPAVGVALSQDSWWMSSYHPEQFRQSYIDNIIEIQKVFYENNLEYNFVNLRNVKNQYKLIIIPGHIMTDESANEYIRNFVQNGGIVIMTGYSGMVDSAGTAYLTPHPGNLSDVFGIRVASFYRTDMPCFFEKNAVLKEHNGKDRELLRLVSGEWEMMLDVDYYEQLELSTAKMVAEYRDKGMCAVSVNSYGKGKAYYVAAESNAEFMKWVVDYAVKDMDVGERFQLPKGVQGRKIAENQYFYVNMNRYQVEFAIPAGGRGVLAEKEFQDRLCLDGYQCELIVREA